MQHCLQFIRALHAAFPVMVHYWLAAPLKHCQLRDLDQIITTILTDPVRIAVDSHHIFVFATHWAKIPLRSFSCRGRDTIRRMLEAVPVPFKMKMNSFYRPKYGGFKYDAYVDARFQRGALVMALAREILRMFPLRHEKRLCRMIIAEQFVCTANENLFATHPLYRDLIKKINEFSIENKN